MEYSSKEYSFICYVNIGILLVFQYLGMWMRAIALHRKKGVQSLTHFILTMLRMTTARSKLIFLRLALLLRKEYNRKTAVRFACLLATQ